MDKIPVRFCKLRDNAIVPKTATESAAGMDLVACIDAPIVLEPGRHASVPTGLAMEMPPGNEAQVRPRSGLAARHGVTVLNSPGTIDADYRGEVAVLLINHGQDPYTVEPGDRIAQLVIAQVHPISVIEVENVSDLSSTNRGAGGFGSTGR